MTSTMTPSKWAIANITQYLQDEAQPFLDGEHHKMAEALIQVSRHLEGCAPQMFDNVLGSEGMSVFVIEPKPMDADTEVEFSPIYGHEHSGYARFESEPTTWELLKQHIAVRAPHAKAAALEVDSGDDLSIADFPSMG